MWASSRGRAAAPRGNLSARRRGYRGTIARSRGARHLGEGGVGGEPRVPAAGCARIDGRDLLAGAGHVARSRWARGRPCARVRHRGEARWTTFGTARPVPTRVAHEVLGAGHRWPRPCLQPASLGRCTSSMTVLVRTRPRLAWIRRPVCARWSTRSRRATLAGTRGLLVRSSLPVVVVMMVVVMHRQPVGVVAVHAHSTPVPAGAIESESPVERAPRVVEVPGHDQRRWWTPVVYPASVVRAPVHEVAVDVVVPAARPVHAREGLDRLGVRMHVRDDLDTVAVRQCLIADHFGSVRGWLVDRGGACHVDGSCIGGRRNYRARSVLGGGGVFALAVAANGESHDHTEHQPRANSGTDLEPDHRGPQVPVLNAGKAPARRDSPGARAARGGRKALRLKERPKEALRTCRRRAHMITL